MGPPLTSIALHKHFRRSAQALLNTVVPHKGQVAAITKGTLRPITSPTRYRRYQDTRGAPTGDGQPPKRSPPANLPTLARHTLFLSLLGWSSFSLPEHLRGHGHDTVCTTHEKRDQGIPWVYAVREDPVKRCRRPELPRTRRRQSVAPCFLLPRLSQSHKKGDLLTCMLPCSSVTAG